MKVFLSHSTQGKAFVEVEWCVVLCKVQFSGCDPGLNQCPKCGAHLHMRVVSGVDAAGECVESDQVESG